MELPGRWTLGIVGDGHMERLIDNRQAEREGQTPAEIMKLWTEHEPGYVLGHARKIGMNVVELREGIYAIDSDDEGKLALFRLFCG